MSFQLSWLDLFCGGGGAAWGITQVPGNMVQLALNHSKIAIATHQHNHPTTWHDCVNIAQTDPRRYPRTDALWASPECTHHTRARGHKRGYGEFKDGLFAADGTDEAAIRSRATMYDVPRFAEAHRYRIIVVENVVEARWWGPDNAPGAAFDAWLSQVKVWGYHHQIVYLDAIHAQALGPGARARRARMYVIFWHRGTPKPDFDKWLRPYGHCPIHGVVQLVQAFKTTKTCRPDRPWGVYGIRNGQYTYRCPHLGRHTARDSIIEPAVRIAAEAIDWDRRLPLLNDRTVPLVASTMTKLSDGWHRHQRRHEQVRTEEPGERAEFARHELLPYYGNSKTVPITVPAPTITTVDTLGLIGYGPTLETSRYRMWTVRENARALEFPDEYQFLGDHDENNMMIGNAVSPPAARDIAAMVTEALTGEDIDRCHDSAA